MSTRWSPDVLGTVTTKGSMTDRPFTFCLLRFRNIMVIYPKWKVPLVEHTYFLEQACSVFSNSFIFFFKQTLLPWQVPYIFMTLLLIFQAHFFYFPNTIPIFFWCCFYYIAVWLQSSLAIVFSSRLHSVFLADLYLFGHILSSLGIPVSLECSVKWPGDCIISHSGNLAVWCYSKSRSQTLSFCVR